MTMAGSSVGFGVLHRWRDERGQALLEFALVMPILLFLLFAILVVGWWMNTQQVLASAARLGARQGALTNDNGQIQGAVAGAVASLDPGATRTSVAIVPSEPSDAGRQRGSPLTVEVVYTMPFTFVGLPTIFQSVRARAIAVMECEPPAGESVCT